MINYKAIESTIKPETKIIDKYSVWINSNIEEFTKTEETESVTMYRYDQVRYSKNEYIQLMSDKNTELNSQLTDVEVALTEVYESKEV